MKAFFFAFIIQLQQVFIEYVADKRALFHCKNFTYLPFLK